MDWKKKTAVPTFALVKGRNTAGVPTGYRRRFFHCCKYVKNTLLKNGVFTASRN